ncbi:MAG: PTS fructose transporter subunit IIA [Acidobacteria bacterium]|nr:MAG: PTS fructose transporter subunit IIA [Acidobacteriota bacterium]
MVGVLVVTHGQLANEFVAAAELIVGEITHIVPVSIGWHVDVNESKKEIEQAIRTVSQGKGIIILTDMFGGTPSNLALSLLRKGELEIVTGVNLPMVIKLAQQTGKETVSELATMVKEQGQKQISIASELLGE